MIVNRCWLGATFDELGVADVEAVSFGGEQILELVLRHHYLGGHLWPDLD